MFFNLLQTWFLCKSFLKSLISGRILTSERIQCRAMMEPSREPSMRFISSLDQHPEVRKERFPAHLWPRTTDPKDLDESWIFLEFTNAVGLRPDCAPVKRQPPMPDLECIIGGKRTLFELGEILESDLAKGLAYSGKQSHKKMETLARGDNATAGSIQTAGFRSFSANASLDAILRRKLAKKYKTTGLPSHLVLFYDQQTPWGPFDYLLQWPDELASLIAGSVFKRVWIFYLQSATLIGYLEVADNGMLRALFDWQFHFDCHVPFQALVPGDNGRPDNIQHLSRFLGVFGVPTDKDSNV